MRKKLFFIFASKLILEMAGNLINIISVSFLTILHRKNSLWSAQTLVNFPCEVHLRHYHNFWLVIFICYYVILRFQISFCELWPQFHCRVHRLNLCVLQISTSVSETWVFHGRDYFEFLRRAVWQTLTDVLEVLATIALTMGR